MEAYPLQWPQGYPRTPAGKRINSKFQTPTDKAVISLHKELIRISNTSNVVISSNIPSRMDGTPYRDDLTRKLPDPGVAVYFTYAKEPVTICCDLYNTPLANITAIRNTLEAMRGIERWGCSDILKRMFTGFKQLPADETQLAIRTFWEILGIEPTKDEGRIRDAYILKAKECHPDLGGDKETFQRLQSAYSEALTFIKST